MKNKPTLLYVEDDQEIMQNILFLLKDYFSHIYTAEDGAEALEKFSQYSPDIVLLDINIPKINGIDVAKEIRKNDADTPILFLTAYSDKEKLMSAINLGASSYIIKPFKINELKDAIVKIISEKGLSNEVVLAYNCIWDIQTNILRYQNKQLKLTKKEIQLLSVLNENRQKFFTACEISSEIFSVTVKDTICNNSVQLLSRFKKKVTTAFEIEDFFIQNIYGIGYKLL